MSKVLKQVIAPGVRWVNGQPVLFTDADCRHFAKTGREMLDAGLPIRFPLDHQSWATLPVEFSDTDDRKAKETLYNKGFVTDFLLDESDNSTWCEIDVPDEEFAKRLQSEIKYVSPRIVPGFTDGNGRWWENAIVHVAATTQPVWHEQKPFGEAPVKPVALSLAEAVAIDKNRPLELSLSHVLELKDGSWVATATEPVDLAVKWEPYSNPKDGRKGWKSVGGTGKGRILYTVQMPGVGKPQATSSKNSPKAPAPKAHAPHAADVSKTLKQFAEALRAPAKHGAAGEVQAPALEAKWPAMPKKPTKADRDQFHKLTIPELKGIAQNLDQHAKELKLSEANLKSTRATYTRWRNATGGSTAKLVDKIKEALDTDRKRMAKGHERAPNGALYAARMVAYRHMLDWAEQDHLAGQDTEANEYAYQLETPLAERLKAIEERKIVHHTSNGQRIISGKQRFAASVARGLFDLGAVKKHDEKMSDKTWQGVLEKYRAARHGGSMEFEKDGLKHTVIVPNPAAFIKAFHENTLRQIRKGEYSDAELKPVLEQLSNAGMGTLSPKEFRDLAKGVMELSLGLDTPRCLHVPLRPALFLGIPIRTALTHPGGPAASIEDQQQFHAQMAGYHQRRQAEHARANNLDIASAHTAAYCHHKALHAIYTHPTDLSLHMRELCWHPVHSSLRYKLRADGKAFEFSLDLDKSAVVGVIELSLDPLDDAHADWKWANDKRQVLHSSRGQVVEMGWRQFETKPRAGRPAGIAAVNSETGRKLYGQAARQALERQNALYAHMATAHGALMPRQKKLKAARESIEVSQLDSGKPEERASGRTMSLVMRHPKQ